MNNYPNIMKHLAAFIQLKIFKNNIDSQTQTKSNYYVPKYGAFK